MCNFPVACMGSTKEAELRRSADMFTEICEGDPYFALAFLIDIQADRAEMQRMLSYIKPHNNK